MRFLAIVALCVASAIAYGIVHDQITARICLEYFTIGHPPILPPSVFESPTWQGIAWGILATWWVGLLLGIPLAIAARAGRRPKRGVGGLLRPIGRLLAGMAAFAALMGLIGYGLGSAGVVRLVGPISSRVPEDRHALYLADLWAHLASYAGGLLGGSLTIVGVWRSRARGEGLDRPPAGGPMGLAVAAGPDAPGEARPSSPTTPEPR
jgi:hypothetical protein